MANVNVTYEDLRSAAKRLEAGQTEITSQLEQLKKLVESLVNGGYVTDASSKQFDLAYQDFNTGATRTIAGLQHMSDYLTKAANTFEGADTALSQSLNRG